MEYFKRRTMRTPILLQIYERMYCSRWRHGPFCSVNFTYYKFVRDFVHDKTRARENTHSIIWGVTNSHRKPSIQESNTFGSRFYRMCHYMSGIQQKGKIRGWQIYLKLPSDDNPDVFNNPQSTKEEIHQCGCEFFSYLCNAAENVLNFLRYRLFSESSAKEKRWILQIFHQQKKQLDNIVSACIW